MYKNILFLFLLSFVEIISINNKSNWINYELEYIKIGVAKDGIYRISYEDLIEFNNDIGNILPNTFQMFLKGEEIPIYVFGEENKIFNSGDYIEFIGRANKGGKHREIGKFNEPYNEYMDRYTDTTVYWLTWNGQLGKRVNTITLEDNKNNSADTIKYYTEISHYEKNLWFDFVTQNQLRRENPNWIENKTWHEGGISVGSNNKNFFVSNVYPNKQFKIFVKLQNWVSNINSDAHLLALGVNNLNDIQDSTYLNKYEKTILEYNGNSNLLIEGNNKLNIYSYKTDAVINKCFFDWHEIEYPRYLSLDDKYLNFSFPNSVSGNYNIKITNVKTNNLSFWKKGKVFEKLIIDNVENSNLIFFDSIKTNDNYYLTEIELINKPKIYYLKKFDDQSNPTLQADYITITHKKFINKANEYNLFLSEKYGIQTILIDIDDIYDNYSYGFFDPEAIKEFLINTKNSWKLPRPKYVFLIGSATYDYYGNKNKYFNNDKVYNYVPSFGAPISDNWFVTEDSLGVANQFMSIGRLPIKSIEEFDRYFEKHKNYLDVEFDGWNKRYILFSSGDGENDSELKALKNVNDFVIDNYISQRPIGGNYFHFYKTSNPKSDFGPFSDDYFQNAIDSGAVFISYLGHSGTRIWDNSIIEPSQLINKKNRSVLVTDFGCSTAKFGEPDIESFSQLFTLSEEGQAIQYIGNSSLGFFSIATEFPKLFYKTILSDSVYRVSDALNTSKKEFRNKFGNNDYYKLLLYTNTLIGDPIISLPIPTKPNLNISNSNFEIDNNSLDDSYKSLKVKIKYYNLGSVFKDSIDINILHTYDNQSTNYSLKKTMPLYQDIIEFEIPIQNRPGIHNLIINLDEQNKIEELYENDNFAEISFNVFSSSVRPLLSYQYSNSISETIQFLNPVERLKSNFLKIELSSRESFENKTEYILNIDNTITNFDVSFLEESKRYWLRTKLEGDNSYSKTVSFQKNKNYKFIADDSLAFSNWDLDSLKINNNSIFLEEGKTEFEVFSSGWLDGNSAIIKKNGINYIPTSSVRGHHVCLFDKNSLKFVEHKLFDNRGDPKSIDSYIEFLDTLSNNYLVIIAIASDAHVTNQTLKEKIKSLGSNYIDSLELASSWAIIGFKGAGKDDVVESYSLANNGPVNISKKYTKEINKGSFTTDIIGPASLWKTINIDSSLDLLNATAILYSTKENILDTIDLGKVINSKNNLEFLNKFNSQYIKFKYDIDKNGLEKFKFNSLSIDYDETSEIGINNANINNKDSVMVGDNIKLSFDVFNLGENISDSIMVLIDLHNHNNLKLRNIFSKEISKINANDEVNVNVDISTLSLSGNYYLNIIADSENKILEVFEDNNFYSIPFYVIGDTTAPYMNITFDGEDIFDGQYISSNPNIKFELSDESLVPISDTSSITFFLNEEQIYFSNNDKLEHNFSNTNPKMIVNYNPKLEDGEYRLTVFAMDASGNKLNEQGITKSFIVSNETKLLNLYNYPNPLSSDTYFTFKLTQIPEDISIRVYTIAGRLVKEIDVPLDKLKYDFNKIYWDGRDEDGDLLGNGVYIYKVIVNNNENSEAITQKLAIIR